MQLKGMTKGNSNIKTIYEEESYEHIIYIG